ncbi:MAG: hypothetical protein JWQ73_3900 [Variovorax sp.]|jgi:hypothetical protein|nr:hypothetical protein [Variovorax sp.]
MHVNLHSVRLDQSFWTLIQSPSSSATPMLSDTWNLSSSEPVGIESIDDGTHRETMNQKGTDQKMTLFLTRVSGE